CREVVFLAQAAADADAAPPAAVTTESHPAKSGWVKSGQTWGRVVFANWRISLIPAAALATAAGLLIWVQTKSAPPAATVAQVGPPSLAPSSIAPPVPPPAQAAAASAVPPVAVQHAQPKAARGARKNPPSETLSMNAPAAREEFSPPAPQLRDPDRFAAPRKLQSMAPQVTAGAPTIAPAVPASASAHANSQAAEKAKWPALASGQHDMNSDVISSLSIAAPPPPAPVPPNLVAVHGNLMAPASAGPRPLAAEAATAGQMELAPQPVNGLAALRLTSHPRLPSGLNAVSSAAMLDRILAVDPDGAVFLSRDAAKHWDRVPVQWTGKAVFVQAPPREFYPLNSAAQKDEALHTSPVAAVSINPEPPAQAPAVPSPPVESMKEAKSATAAPGPPPSPANADAALPIPGMLFKLINDRHQTWVSADGKIWRQQQGRE
ncbi:MAG TPA: hypothetical protein VGG62_02335, partial [Terracidiphilus sp.]